jgi:aminoglycoside 3-N-acetyltransferase
MQSMEAVHLHTSSSLRRDFEALGVQRGMTLLVHSSMRAVGAVAGGPQAVCVALLAAVGRYGNVVVPAFSIDNADPSHWGHRTVCADQLEAIGRDLPAYNKRFTPTYGMGAIAECMRSGPGARRSSHPETSFAAVGPDADYITRNHSLQRFGEESPLARLYDLKAHVLLIGVGFRRNTSFHLAEYRSSYRGKRTGVRRLPVPIGRRLSWQEVDDVVFYEEDFETIGAGYLSHSDRVAYGQVGNASCMLFPQTEVVDYSYRWMDEFRALGLGSK